MGGDRRAILERRRRFVAATLAALSGSVTSACPAPTPAVTPLGHGTPPGEPRSTARGGASAGGAGGAVGTAGAGGALDAGGAGATPSPPPDLAQLDSDGDGVPDARDACPELSGVAAVGSTRDGCPPQPCLSIAHEPRIAQRIAFASGDATLSPESRVVLTEIARALAVDELMELDVVGHTDVSEPEQLAELRARRVRDFLVARGVAPTRLVAVGKGAREPIDTNATEEGRRNNRRVEFLVRGVRRP